MRLPSHLCKSFIDSWLKDEHICFFLRLEYTAGFCFKFIKVEKTVYMGTGCQTYWKTAAWHLLSRWFPGEKQQQAAIYRAAIANCLRERDRKIR